MVGIAPPLTGAQLRAARALLGITAAELAERAGLGLATIRRAEAVDGPVKMTIANARHLVDTLNRSGIEFLGGADGAEGVRRKDFEADDSYGDGTKSEVARNLKDMLQDGLVIAVEARGERRYHLTPKGHKVIAEMRAVGVLPPAST